MSPAKAGARAARWSVFYSGSFNPSGNAYLSLYGWLCDGSSPLVEWYIVDSWGTYRPNGDETGKYRGYHDADGSTYLLYESTRTQVPHGCGTGNATFKQYWSVRKPEFKRTGTGKTQITTWKHMEAWDNPSFRNKGSPTTRMPFDGDFGYMVVATEGYQSSGNSRIDIKA